MMPNLSSRNRAARLFTSAALMFVGAVLWPGAPDLFCLLGATTFMTGVLGWCPLVEPSWESVSQHPQDSSSVTSLLRCERDPRRH
jgi:hypothetical protein